MASLPFFLPISLLCTQVCRLAYPSLFDFFLARIFYRVVLVIFFAGWSPRNCFSMSFCALWDQVLHFSSYRPGHIWSIEPAMGFFLGL